MKCPHCDGPQDHAVELYVNAPYECGWCYEYFTVTSYFAVEGIFKVEGAK